MIAGPYRSGAKTEAESERNLRRLNEAAAKVLAKGHVPIIGVNLALPIIAAAGDEHYNEIMLPLSLAVADRCDAILRLGAESAGADDEVDRIRARGGQVFRNIAEVPAAG
jgi:hypothetical protein